MSIVPLVCFSNQSVPPGFPTYTLAAKWLRQNCICWRDVTEKLASMKRIRSVQFGRHERSRGNHVQNTMIPTILRALSGTFLLENNRRKVCTYRLILATIMIG